MHQLSLSAVFPKEGLIMGHQHDFEFRSAFPPPSGGKPKTFDLTPPDLTLDIRTNTNLFKEILDKQAKALEDYVTKCAELFGISVEELGKLYYLEAIQDDSILQDNYDWNSYRLVTHITYRLRPRPAVPKED
jgi:hypothetical protein